jgi:SAM-dependent methyltransferase
MRAFADHFSRLSTGYARYRPQYPEGLFAAIAAANLSHEVVWDCATGTGQAVRGLARHFAVVLASDASREQVAVAARHERARYLVARAEAAPLRANSVCMVTVAQALHWLELAEFYAEARRVLRPGGLLVVWTYGHQRIDGGRLDAVLHDFYHRVIGPYWPPQRRWVETGYRTLRFPFEEVTLQAPPMSADWTLDQLLGYIGTWSAVARCRESSGMDPMSELADRVRPLWGDAAVSRRIEWPISVRAGR